MCQNLKKSVQIEQQWNLMLIHIITLINSLWCVHIHIYTLWPTNKHPENEQGLCCGMPRGREEFKVMHNSAFCSRQWRTTFRLWKQRAYPKKKQKKTKRQKSKCYLSSILREFSRLILWSSSFITSGSCFFLCFDMVFVVMEPILSNATCKHKESLIQQMHQNFLWNSESCLTVNRSSGSNRWWVVICRILITSPTWWVITNSSSFICNWGWQLLKHPFQSSKLFLYFVFFIKKTRKIKKATLVVP